MSAPTWHDLDLRVVTPAFFGRFAPKVTAQTVPFPVSSLRGSLAYWLRALAGAHVGGDLDRLHAIESAVFGAARAHNAGGPSPILLRGPRVKLTVFPARDAAAGVRYLLGPGLLGQPPPRCLAAGQTVRLRVKNTGSPEKADLFLAALWALRAFGGLGARTRRGLGTVALDSVPGPPVRRFEKRWLERDDLTDLDAVLDCVLSAIRTLGLEPPEPPLSDSAPRYPCFAHGHFTLGQDDLTSGAATAALDVTGQWWRNFRHGGDRDNTGSYHSDTYTAVAQPFLDGGHPRGPLLAGAFGLPIPYSDHQGSSSRGQRTATAEVLIDGLPARRASPLWLRVRKDGPRWRLRSLAFHAEWLPPDAPLRIKSGGRSASVERPSPARIRTEVERWFHRPDTP